MLSTYLLILSLISNTFSPTHITLDSVTSILVKNADKDETNCIKSAYLAIETLVGAKFQLESYIWSNHQVISRDVIPALKGGGLKAIRVLFALPDAVEHHSEHVQLIPTAHAFVIVGDNHHAALCQSWEGTMRLSCGVPTALDDFVEQLFDLDRGIAQYVVSPSREKHECVVQWFLNDTRPIWDDTPVTKEWYDHEINDESVEFFRSKLPEHRIPEFFAWVESEGDPVALTQQMRSILLAGKAIASSLVMKNHNSPF